MSSKLSPHEFSSVSYNNLNTNLGSPCGEADEVSAGNPQAHPSGIRRYEPPQ